MELESLYLVAHMAELEPANPLRVLSLDGGGMRGIYSAVYLDRMASAAAKNRELEALDIGASFDLIVGTSTGGILACALVKGVPLAGVIDLYRAAGPMIFQSPIPSGLGLETVRQFIMRPTELRAGALELKRALSQKLGRTTVAQVFERRGIALAIPAINMNTHEAWVFKTPHLEDTNHRDDDFELTDVCLATSAAPIYRSLAAVDTPGDYGGHLVFADGGLWANNPVLVALTEAMRMTQPETPLEIYCMGTCPKPTGERIGKEEVDRGFAEWKLGGKATELAVDAQEFAFDNIARMLAGNIGQPCRIVRFPSDDVPPDDAKFLNLDETSDEGLDALVRLALRDADRANSMKQDKANADGQLIKRLFDNMPAAEEPAPSGLAVEAAREE